MNGSWDGTDDQPLGDDGELRNLMAPHFAKVAAKNAERDARIKAAKQRNAERGTFIVEYNPKNMRWDDRHKLDTRLPGNDVARLNEACKPSWKVVNR